MPQYILERQDVLNLTLREAWWMAARKPPRFADKTREALAFEQLRSRRTHVIVYARGYFEIFETLSFVQLGLKLPPLAQDRLLRLPPPELVSLTIRRRRAFMR